MKYESMSLDELEKLHAQLHKEKNDLRNELVKLTKVIRYKRKEKETKVKIAELRSQINISFWDKIKGLFK
jgi:hypothetical protein